MEEHRELVENEVLSFGDLVPDFHISKLVHPIFMVELPYLEGMAFMHEVGVSNLAIKMATKIENYSTNYVLICGITNFMVLQQEDYYEI